MGDLTGMNIFVITFSILPITGNFMNVFFIIAKERLRVPMYYIVIAIAAANSIFAISSVSAVILGATKTATFYNSSYSSNSTTSEGTITQQKGPVIFYVIIKATYLTSIFSTVLLSIDRFIAIKYCLIYYQFVTKSKIFISVVLIWITAGLTATIPFGKKPELVSAIQSTDYRTHVVSWSLLAISTVTVIAIAIHTNSIRGKHIREIEIQKLNAGHKAQQLTILRRLKQSLQDLIRFYFVTATFTCLHLLSIMLGLYVNPSLYKLNGVFSLIYMMLNPYLFIITMTDLRNVHQNFWSRLCFFRKNAIDPTTRSNISSANERALPSNNIVAHAC